MLDQKASSLESKIALVTGANRGLGLETARQLAAKGVKVLMAGRSEGAIHAAADELRAEGLEGLSALKADAFRHNELYLVAFGCSDHCEPYAGVAACRFEYGKAGFQPAFLFRVLYHKMRDPVLY